MKIMQFRASDTFGLPIVRAPLGAVRIFAREAGRSILIEAGADRDAGPDERLAGVWWFSTGAIADDVVEKCLDLLFAARFYPVDGWITFPANKISNVVNAAKTHLNVQTVTRLADPPPAARLRSKWTRRRCAWLGYLVGQGSDAKRVADDPLIQSTPNNVYRQAHRLGLSFVGGFGAYGALRLPMGTGAAYDRAATRLGLTREAAIRRAVIAAAADPDTLDRLLSAG